MQLNLPLLARAIGEAFEDKMRHLSTQWHAQQQEVVRLDVLIERNLKHPGFSPEEFV